MIPGPLIVDIAGNHLASEDRELLAHPLVGGVILFARNCPDAAAVAALSREIHALRTPPLLITIDQEGGRVQRLTAGVTRLPSPARLGAVYERDAGAACRLARGVGWLMATELRALDVDVSFSPVLDLGGRSRVIGDRAFHRDAEIVSELALAWSRGMEAAGMRPVAKHFPGHGGVAGDSHVERPVDRRSYSELAVSDLMPFERLMLRGLAGLMLNHVVYPRVAPEPASLSRVWIHDILRGEFGFEGVAVADDLSMAAVAAWGSAPSRVAAALAAGCDLVLLCNDRTAVNAVIGAADILPLNPASALRRSRLTPIRDKPGPEMGLEYLQQVRRAVKHLENGDSFTLES